VFEPVRRQRTSEEDPLELHDGRGHNAKCAPAREARVNSEPHRINNA
jgi:hypothetical protein